MFGRFASLPELARIIQVALTPVFFLTAVPMFTIGALGLFLVEMLMET